MGVVEIKCLCGHSNRYDLEAPGGKFHVCVDPPGTKKFTKTPSVGLVGDYCVWMCPICGTLKGVRLMTR
jgi:hypothetical protein